MVELDTKGGAWTGGEALIRHDVMNAKRDIERIKAQLETAELKLAGLQSRCEHRHTTKVDYPQVADYYLICQVCDHRMESGL